MLVFGLAIPIPAKWNIIVDNHGATIEDYVWYISYYGVLTLVLFMLFKLTNNIAIKLLFLLSIGKLIDQFFNPYGYHAPEIIWDIIIASWISIEQINQWREHKSS